jgi:hypothetical protein
MGMIKLISTPVRTLVRSRLVQLIFVVIVIFFLQAADDKSLFGQIFNALDKVVDQTVGLFAAIFDVKSFTKAWLVSGLMIAYVYFVCLLILFVLRVLIRALVDFVGRNNAFGLRTAIARERGIAAYRAWVPFEKIRPPDIPQEHWEASFAWPPNNKVPCPASKIRGRSVRSRSVPTSSALTMRSSSWGKMPVGARSRGCARPPQCRSREAPTGASLEKRNTGLQDGSLQT